jgi:hypothetical protein
MEPSESGINTGGLYYIQVNREHPTLVDSTIMMATLFTRMDSHAHEPKEYLAKNTRLIITEEYAKQVFLREPVLRDFQDVFCYLQDPDFSLSGECITVQIRLPDISFEKTIWLDQSNEFRVNFITNGRISYEVFVDCYAGDVVLQ